jgi:sRNA-binding regulator protein Hfq
MCYAADNENRLICVRARKSIVTSYYIAGIKIIGKVNKFTAHEF